MILKSVLLILCAMLLFNCTKMGDLVYTASTYRPGNVNNRIRMSTLDSIVSSRNLIYLSDYKSRDNADRRVIKMIKDTVQKLGFKTKQFTIVREKNDRISQRFSGYFFDPQDSIIAFKLYHVDGYVHDYNLEKLNAESKKHPQPDGAYKVLFVTGNISGFDGVYMYNQNRNKLYILRYQ